MLGTTTATTSTTTTPLPSLHMSLSSSPETNATQMSFNKPIDPAQATMPRFTPGQCLFCPDAASTFADSVTHMQKSHGLFVPLSQYLIVDLKTLYSYLHLVIFEYRECIQCGTERATVQGVQQHMTGKGHCKFDISNQDSEFAEFYDFSDPEEDGKSDIWGDSERQERNLDETATRSSPKPVMADEHSIRLPSGKIISRHLPAHMAPSPTKFRRRTQTLASRLEYSVAKDSDEEGSSNEEADSDIPETQLLSKSKKREKAAVTYQLSNMRANDRTSLMHLSTSEQRSILATQHRHAEKVQKQESRRRTRIDRKGNKNLYAYWHTETPVYQCG